jgi:ABC-type multidrug transport system ATPase subunit
MNISLDSVGKRFQYDWIFKNFSYHFKSGQSYAILGPNGSGKSTLMKILSGHLTPSVGKLNFEEIGKNIDPDNIYKNLSYAAPYIDLIEEMTLSEMIVFYNRFKPLSKGIDLKQIVDILKLPKAENKEIRYFSSGMKQRLKLAMAICTQAPLLLLDEPTSNLDTQGIDWYRGLISTYTEGPNADYSNGGRLVIVASNISHEYDFCKEKIDIQNFK